MRISVDANDAGHAEAVRVGLNVNYSNVRLNGEVLHGVITADEDVGLLIVYKTENGRPVIRGGNLVTEILYGKVEIELTFDGEGNWPHQGLPKPDRNS